MKTHSKILFKFKMLYSFCLLLAILFFISPSYGKNLSEEQVLKAFKGWLRISPHPLNAQLNVNNIKIKAFKNTNDTTTFYVISFKTEGFAVLSANDLIQPVIAFSATGHFDETSKNPLFSIISSDINNRQKIAELYQLELDNNTLEKSTNSPLLKIKQKWRTLINTGISDEPTDAGIEESEMDEIIVAPFLKTEWSQSSTNNGACYNYYTPTGLDDTNTPKWEAGNELNYPTGCVACALGQVMKYFEYPNSPINTTTAYPIEVDGVKENKFLRGGDGNGSAYLWDLMTEKPKIADSLTDDSRKAIGSLLYDCGLSVEMSYTAEDSSGYSTQVANSLMNVFGYSNAILAYKAQSEIESNILLNILNSNLNAKLPVILGLTREPNFGHAVVCDGYGYNNGTIYHHINLGWNGAQNIWYDLPDVDPYDDKTYNIIDIAIYNIYTTGNGEIVTGKVLDESNNPLEGITVTINDKTAVTNSKGIYVFRGIPSNTQITISCPKAQAIQRQTGLSAYRRSGDYTVGNIIDANLQIGSSQPTTYTLTVNQGSGSGTYTAGEIVSITADQPADGFVFDKWVASDTTNINEITSSTTNITMPEANYTVSATYKEISIDTYSISGIIAGDVQENVTITLSGDVSKTTLSSSDGSFIFTDILAGSYNVTPSLNSYTFSPDSTSLTITSENHPNINFTASKSKPGFNKLTVINGSGSGSYVANEQIVISATIPSGKVFKEWIGDTSSILPQDSQTTIVFMPNNDITLTATFQDPTLGTYRLSGKISGDILSGVTLSLSLAGSRIKETVSDANGDYFFDTLSAGDYIVTASIPGYELTPKSTAISITDSDVNEINFTTTRTASYSHELTVLNGTGSGTYLFNSLVNIQATPPIGKKFSYWTGDIRNIADIFAATTTFTMPDKDAVLRAIFEDDISTQFSITGTITGDIIGGVQVYIDQTHNAMTDTSGNYTISNLETGTYTVTPIKSGYTFTPENISVTISDSNINNINFTSNASTPDTSDIFQVCNGTEFYYRPSTIMSKKPKVFAELPNGKKVSYKILKGSDGEVVYFTWTKKLRLYDKKDFKNGYKIFFDTYGALPNLQLITNILYKKDNILLQNNDFYLVPPVITAIKNASNTSVITEAQAEDSIILEGKDFGAKPPKVYLELDNQLFKCKIDKSYLIFKDYKGKESCMDVLGNSALMIILPKEKKLSPGLYSIVLDNKIGIATTPKTSSDKGHLPTILIFR